MMFSNRWLRRAMLGATGLLLAGLVAACEMAPEQSAEPESPGGSPSGAADGTRQPHVKLLDYSWMPSPKGFFDRDIAICIAGSTLQRPDNDLLLNYWSHTLNRSIGQATGLSFSGWQACRAGGAQPNTINVGVSIVPEPDCSNAGGGSTIWHSNTPVWGVTWADILICQNEIWNDSVVIHEFLHALGFDHEFERSDYPQISAANCPNGMGSNGSSTLWTEGTLADPFSMSHSGYCHWLIELSSQDTVGLRNSWGHPNYFADVTGDGADDAIILNPEGAYVIPNTGKADATGGHFKGAATYWGGPQGQQGTFFVDVTGDRRADAVAVSANNILVAVSTGSPPFSPASSWATGSVYGVQGTYFADINGDGRADAIRMLPKDWTIVGDNDRVFEVRYSTGRAFGPAQKLYGMPQPRYVGSQGWFADVTGKDSDGKRRADFIHYNPLLGGVMVSKNMKNGVFGTPELWLAQLGNWLGTTQDPGLPAFFADVNGDNRDDYVYTIAGTGFQADGEPEAESFVTINSSGSSFDTATQTTINPGMEFKKGVFAAKLSKTSGKRTLVWVDGNSVYGRDGGVNWDLTRRPFHGQRMYTMGSAWASNVLTTPTNDWIEAHAVDGNPATAYSSVRSDSASNTNWWSLDGYLANGAQQVKTVVLTARVYNGQPMAFPVGYHIYVLSPDGAQWLWVGHYTAQPAAPSWNVIIPLPSTYMTPGVAIAPSTFGTDIWGHYYLQLAEIRVGPP